MSNVFLDDGWTFMIRDLSKDEMQGLLKLINSAELPERRMFYSLKTQIEKILKI